MEVEVEVEVEKLGVTLGGMDGGGGFAGLHSPKMGTLSTGAGWEWMGEPMPW